jgi:hypothetical protein
MRPKFQLQQLRKTTPAEYLLRFAFGGAVALVASAVGQAWGPRVGGLFLAFPALLPAGLLLVKQHDGRRAAANDARGALLGSLGLIGFAAAIWSAADRLAPWLSLSLALAAWVGLSVGAWWGLLARRRAGHARCTQLVGTELDESEV